MRQQDQQIQDEQRTDRTAVKVDDRDRADDPERADTNDRTDNLDLENARNHTDDLVRDDGNRTDDPNRVDHLDRVEYHEPAPLPTTFGAPTVGGAVAASALASGDRTEEPDPREESTVAPDNGVGDGQVNDAVTRVSPTGTSDRSSAGPGTGTVTPLPGEGDGIGSLLDTETTERLRERWRGMQLRFVDDPPGALDEARELVDEAVRSFTTALTEQRTRLDDDGGTGSAGSGETEHIRLAIRRYRDFLDRLLDR
ncbi:hypothetical protein BDK92_2321 [Micromonospora pisi]|uniref:Uncharacterized protein n=1 Tax=Micromonospora pisi TaxID=589240 RepID=A0A495JGI4_9ACTN|nr:hypothetical protein [Micromonospora pisi]RKR88017.1 hypothetical protein BDK92_2321 [Micromonospora pisi]